VIRVLPSLYSSYNLIELPLGLDEALSVQGGKVPSSQKTSQKAIVAAAAAIVEQDGAEALSIRAVARRLGLAPNALRSYFPDRKTLVAAVAAEGMRGLHLALKRAAKGSAGAEAVSRACQAYLRFARKRPALYAMMMQRYADTPQLLAARTGLGDFSRALFASLQEPGLVTTAGLAWWASLHGMAVLARDGLLDDRDLAADSFSGVWALITAAPRSLPR
jgi:AcrR family transcriptional regulator